MRRDEVDELIDETRDEDPRVRNAAVRELCPCELKYNDPRVWDRLIEMADDPDPKVRYAVVHNLCDGSPRARTEQIVAALKRMWNDDDLKLRRRVRKVLGAYEREGTINVL